MSRRRGGSAAALLAAAVVGACGDADERASTTTVTARTLDARAEPQAPEPARATRRYTTAWLTRATALRSGPGGRVLTRLRTKTEFGSPMVLAVAGRRDGWLKVSSAKLRNGRHGWIRARDARLRSTDYAIHVDRSARRAVLRHDGREVLRFRVAVGRPGNETPLGRFAVTDKLRTGRGPSPYGCCIVALTGHQTKLDPDWVGGDRLAIHGTPLPATVGQAVSLGCMRARTGAIRALMRRVPLGMPVIIRA